MAEVNSFDIDERFENCQEKSTSAAGSVEFWLENFEEENRAFGGVEVEMGQNEEGIVELKGHNKASGGYGFAKVREEDEEELKKLVSKLKLDGKDLRAWSAGERPSSPTLVFRVILLGAGTCNLDRWFEGVWIPVRATKKY